MTVLGETVSTLQNDNLYIEEEIIKIKKPKNNFFKKLLKKLKFKKKKKSKTKISFEFEYETNEVNDASETNNFNTLRANSVSFAVPKVCVSKSNICTSNYNTVRSTSSQCLTVPSSSILNNSLFTLPSATEKSATLEDDYISEADTEVTLVDPVVIAENRKNSKKKKRKLLSVKRRRHRRTHSWQDGCFKEHVEDPRNCLTVTDIKDILSANNKVELHNDISDSHELILNDELAMEIRKHVPPFYRNACKDWYLEYSLGEHGSSLTTFYESQMDCDSPIIMAISDCYGEVFGAYLNQPFNPAVSGFTGNRECFLWKKTNDGLRVYRASSINEYYMMADQDFIALGVDKKGVFGLFLDNLLLNGESSSCDTYLNDVLSSKKHFQCSSLEIWSLQFE